MTEAFVELLRAIGILAMFAALACGIKMLETFAI